MCLRKEGEKGFPKKGKGGNGISYIVNISIITLKCFVIYLWHNIGILENSIVPGWRQVGQGH